MQNVQARVSRLLALPTSSGLIMHFFHSAEIVGSADKQRFDHAFFSFGCGIGCHQWRSKLRQFCASL
jgi:hypothetical protein